MGKREVWVGYIEGVTAFAEFAYIIIYLHNYELFSGGGIKIRNYKLIIKRI